MEKETIPTCVDCGTQNCKYKDRTYPDFCPTDNLKEEDRKWALERYDEGRNREIMIASAEVEYEGYCQWTRVQEIMEFARKIGAHRIGIANCIGLIREARIFARILRANGFEAYSIICKVAGQPKTSMGIPAQRKHRCRHVQPDSASPSAERSTYRPERGNRSLRGTRQPVLQILRCLRHYPRNQGPCDRQ